jgi:predicted ester cyclase
MTSEETRALLHCWFQEVWNEGKESTIYELFSEHGKAHGWPEPDSVLQGPAAFVEVHRHFSKIFSNITMKIEDVFTEGDRGAIRWTCTMKHTGEGLGFAATGTTVTLAGASFMVCKDGKLMDGWNFLDQTRAIQDLKAVSEKMAVRTASTR